MTYLELINDVLVRLREEQVSTANETGYSSLIGKFVNDAKRQIEDSYGWNVLGETVTVTTTPGTFSYALTGAGQKFQVMDAVSISGNYGLRNIGFVEMNRLQSFTPTGTGSPTEFVFDGVDNNGDAKVTLYPRPDAVYTLAFALTVPQARLTTDGAVVKVPDVLVAQNAFARALVERGEDGGLNSSEAFQLYQSMLSDYIALESTRFPESQEFIAI